MVITLAFSGLLAFYVLWLIGMTLASLALLAGLRGERVTGAVLVSAYTVFVCVHLAST